MRSIPARAGEPAIGTALRTGDGVYPRACGGTPRASKPSCAALGLSPRVRGNRGPAMPYSTDPGSIPARAGEPYPRRYVPSLPWVYPRACGGTWRIASTGRTRWGLSPRVRGNPQETARERAAFGSIPARAGEPSPRPVIDSMLEVYPRACGGTPALRAGRRNNRGLSPRVRGNRRNVDGRQRIEGSIPARAGEPISSGL